MPAGLDFLHSNHVIHQYVKSCNISQNWWLCQTQSVYSWSGTTFQGYGVWHCFWVTASSPKVVLVAVQGQPSLSLNPHRASQISPSPCSTYSLHLLCLQCVLEGLPPGTRGSFILHAYSDLGLSTDASKKDVWQLVLIKAGDLGIWKPWAGIGRTSSTVQKTHNSCQIVRTPGACFYAGKAWIPSGQTPGKGLSFGLSLGNVISDFVKHVSAFYRKEKEDLMELFVRCSTAHNFVKSTSKPEF